MSIYGGPRINTNNLIYCFDAKNFKSFSKKSSRNHGFSEWYCFESTTAVYSIISSGVSIIEKQSNGTTSVIVSTTTGPSRGTISVVQGRIYYGIGGPINLVAEDQHHLIAPLTIAGTQFCWVATRNTPGTCYIYSPFENSQIKFWDNPASGGISNSSPTSTFTLNSLSQTSFTFDTPANFETVEYFYLTSTDPVLVTTTQNGVDKTILSPASKYFYQRYNAYYSTVISTTPSSVQYGCISDSINSVFAQSIADGAGGDTAHGLGLEFLSDTYSWGNVLSDYVISCPYDCTVTVSYWNGSSWVVWETHTITNSSLANPVVVSRDGTQGAGVNATNINGTASNMASEANLWKWEGTQIFYLGINDSVDDEFSVLGWMNGTTDLLNTNQYINDSIQTEKLAIQGSLIYDSNGYFSFPNNQITNYLIRTSFPMPTDDHTISCWFRSNFNQASQTPYTYSVNGDNELLLYTDSSTIIVPHSKGDRYAITVSNMQNKWCNFVRTRIKTTGSEKYYMNGVLVGERVIYANQSITSGGSLIIGQEADSLNGGFDTNQNLDGDFARLEIYNRVLTDDEVKQNFNALRSRFGI